MADIFEYLEFQAESDNEPMRKAAAIAVSRAERVFSFLKKASSKNEFDSRLALVEDNIQKIVTEACEEFGYDDTEHISKVVRGQIELLAADVETGDNYYQRRDDLPAAPADGSLSEPSPKLDPNRAGDQWHTFQDEPSVESVRNRADRQDADQKADYAAEMGEESGINHPLVNRVDADKPMQPEFNVGDSTKTFPNKNQAQPVASQKRADYEPSIREQRDDQLRGWDDFFQECLQDGMEDEEIMSWALREYDDQVDYAQGLVLDAERQLDGLEGNADEEQLAAIHDAEREYDEALYERDLAADMISELLNDYKQKSNNTVQSSKKKVRRTSK